MDSEILKNFIVTKSVFKRGDHQISIDNAFADTNKIEHENILIDDCEFYASARFNIALANTRNAVILIIKEWMVAYKAIHKLYTLNMTQEMC